MGKDSTAEDDPDYLDRLIDEREAASFLGYSVRALQNWRVRGGGPRFVKVSDLGGVGAKPPAAHDRMRRVYSQHVR